MGMGKSGGKTGLHITSRKNQARHVHSFFADSRATKNKKVKGDIDLKHHQTHL
jgi:hypothetical protein